MMLARVATKMARPWLRALLSTILIAACVSCSVTGPRDTASLIAELDAKIPDVVARGKSPSIQAGTPLASGTLLQ